MEQEQLRLQAQVERIERNRQLAQQALQTKQQELTAIKTNLEQVKENANLAKEYFANLEEFCFTKSKQEWSEEEEN